MAGCHFIGIQSGRSLHKTKQLLSAGAPFVSTCFYPVVAFIGTIWFVFSLGYHDEHQQLIINKRILCLYKQRWFNFLRSYIGYPLIKGCYIRLLYSKYSTFIVDSNKYMSALAIGKGHYLSSKLINT